MSMKKIPALFLAVVMSLSLVACGGVESPNAESTTSIGKTENIDETRISENTGNVVPEPSVSSEDDEQIAITSKFLSYMCGEWKLLNIEDEGVLESVIIFEDGNINIDGSDFMWKILNETEDAATCRIIDGETVIGSFHFGVEDNGDIRLSISGVTDSEVSLYKPAHYEVVTVTLDNVYEYFEFRDFWKENRNAFDELMSIRIDTRLVLKEEYYSRLSQRTMGSGYSETVAENGAIEWFYKRSGLDVVLDVENKTYTFENFRSGTEDTVTGVQAFSFNDEYAGFWATFMELAPDSEGRHTYTWACVYEKEITRLELELYLIAENN